MLKSSYPILLSPLTSDARGESGQMVGIVFITVRLLQLKEGHLENINIFDLGIINMYSLPNWSTLLHSCFHTITMHAWPALHQELGPIIL